MGDVYLDEGILDDIADAIRTKTEKTATIAYNELATEISSIQTSGSGGLQIKRGEMTAATIDTGLTSVVAFAIFAVNSSTGLGLYSAIYDSLYNAQYARVAYCSSASDYLKMHSVGTSSAFTISGGVIEWTGTGNYALQEDNTYQYFAIGS